MNCPRCKTPLTEANFFIDTFDDQTADLAQIVVSHSACGYRGYVLLTGTSLVEVVPEGGACNVA
jgi:hypothetical protein